MRRGSGDPSLTKMARMMEELSWLYWELMFVPADARNQTHDHGSALTG